MAVAFVGGAALGAVFGELLAAVVDAKKKASQFKPTLNRLESTLTLINPIIKEIEELNRVLDRPEEEAAALIAKIREGETLVRSCSKVKWLWQKWRYANKLLELDESLCKFFQIDMQVLQTRDTKEILVVVKNIRKEMVKLINGEDESQVAGHNNEDVMLQHDTLTEPAMDQSCLEPVEQRRGRKSSRRAGEDGGDGGRTIFFLGLFLASCYFFGGFFSCVLFIGFIALYDDLDESSKGGDKGGIITFFGVFLASYYFLGRFFSSALSFWFTALYYTFDQKSRGGGEEAITIILSGLFLASCYFFGGFFSFALFCVLSGLYCAFDQNGEGGGEEAKIIVLSGLFLASYYFYGRFFSFAFLLVTVVLHDAFGQSSKGGDKGRTIIILGLFLASYYFFGGFFSFALLIGFNVLRITFDLSMEYFSRRQMEQRSRRRRAISLLCLFLASYYFFGGLFSFALFSFAALIGLIVFCVSVNWSSKGGGTEEIRRGQEEAKEEKAKKEEEKRQEQDQMPHIEGAAEEE